MTSKEIYKQLGKALQDCQQADDAGTINVPVTIEDLKQAPNLPVLPEGDLAAYLQQQIRYMPPKIVRIPRAENAALKVAADKVIELCGNLADTIRAEFPHNE